MYLNYKLSDVEVCFWETVREIWGTVSVPQNALKKHWLWELNWEKPPQSRWNSMRSRCYGNRCYGNPRYLKLQRRIYSPSATNASNHTHLRIRRC